MSALREVVVPDIGEFDRVDVIEVLVAQGDTVAVEQSLITLESDKATMEIPAPMAGTVKSLAVDVGSQVSQGDLILTLEVEGVEGVSEAAAPEQSATESAQAVASAEPSSASSEDAAAPPGAAPDTLPQPTLAELPAADQTADVVVLGAGPGGYTAAFRAADLGKQVVLVERDSALGGVCLNVGCIPSKALLHLADVITKTRAVARHGIRFGEPEIDLDAVRSFKDGVVQKLSGGLAGLAKRRKVEVLRGSAEFEAPNLLRVRGDGGERGETTVAFHNAVIAVGSRPVALPGTPEDDDRIMDSTAALALEDIPERLLIVGGGIIGLEMASVYAALGSRITVVELLDELMAGADRDLVKPLQKIIGERYENVFLGTRVTSMASEPEGVRIGFEGPNAPESDLFDRVLVAVGRAPNGGSIAAEKASVQVDERGFIAVDAQQRTNVPHIFAIGDVVGDPMLAHKATHEGRVAAEVISGEKSAFDAQAIPSVAYTDPEVAWMGLTETAAKAQGIAIRKASFPWQASGRALGIDRSEGATKLILEDSTGRLLGAGIVGPNAGELIGELVLALELGADAEDIALTIHPHPTLSETVAFAAELAEGTITDLYVPKRKPRGSA